MNLKKQKRKRIGLVDVAKILSLSPSTISKALNNSSDIAEETKVRVKKACEKLGYRPNLLAKSLISNKSRILGILVPDLRISFFSEAVRGMYEEAKEKKYQCIILVHDENELVEKEKLEFLSDIGVDGILLNSIGSKNNFKLYKKFKDEGIKVVCWDRNVDESLKYKSVKINDVQASFELTSRIIKQNKKNILFLGPISGSQLFSDRYLGYKMALEKNDIPFNKDLVRQTFRNSEDSYKTMLTLLDSGIRIDGIVSIGGLVTYGVGRALLERNISIPKDVILGDFGDNDIVYRLGIPFYTVFQNPYQLGKSSTDLLIRMIEKKDKNESYSDIIIDYEILEKNFLYK
ncbi:MAG: LacI family DNA-binding transcriptional regulator [Ignavibacteriaceae bacterium]|nr:LacI family DNA-binding transcriptional regulator [Ignavibacteriaceae bacterium]